MVSKMEGVSRFVIGLSAEVAAYRRNLVGGSPSISIAMSDEAIAWRLLERFHSKSIIEKNGKWLEMALGKGRFQRIFDMVHDSMRYMLYNQPTDMRKSYHSLSGMVSNSMGCAMPLQIT